MKGARARDDVLVTNSCEALTNLVGRYNLARLRSREIKSRQLNGPALCRAAEPTVSCHRQRVTEGQSLSVYSLPTPPPCPIVPCQSRRPSGGMVGGVGNLAGSRGSPRGERMHEPSGAGERCGVASMRGGTHGVTSEYASISFARKSGRGTRADVVRPPKADCVRRSSGPPMSLCSARL